MQVIVNTGRSARGGWRVAGRPDVPLVARQHVGAAVGGVVAGGAGLARRPHVLAGAGRVVEARHVRDREHAARVLAVEQVPPAPDRRRVAAAMPAR
ncbi:MAG TPA: hypothetical protein VGE42_11080 [Candidatus Dormibacteraeota bacterium]